VIFKNNFEGVSSHLKERTFECRDFIGKTSAIQGSVQKTSESEFLAKYAFPTETFWKKSFFA